MAYNTENTWGKRSTEAEMPVMRGSATRGKLSAASWTTGVPKLLGHGAQSWAKVAC